MKTKLGLLFFGLAASAMAAARAPVRSVRVMLMPYETAGELAEAGVLEGGNALMPAQTGRFPSAGRAGFAPGASPKAPAQLGGAFILKAGDSREAEPWARRCPSVLRGAEVELRPVMPKMGPKPGAGE